MSTPGLINHYPFIPGMPQAFPFNNINASTNLLPFSTNAQPIAVTGLSSIPFMNSCDLGSQLISPIAYNFVSDIDLMNGEQFVTDNTLTIRIIMSGKEVGSIIGKRGDNIKRFREESMARINISDGNSPERIVTISGNCDQIHHAIKLMCKKLEDDAIKALDKLTESKSPVLSIRLLIQPVQYSGIIGNGGGRMTQLRETCDAKILFGMDFLPNSSERLLTISGFPESIVTCILEICKILIEIPCNTYVLPYSPKPVACNNLQQPMVSIGNNKMTSPSFIDTMSVAASRLPILPMQNIYPQSFFPDQMAYPIGLPISLIPLKIPNPMSPYLQKPSYDSSWNPSSNSLQLQQQNVSREFFVENEMIGCIIGRGGSTINEIRAISGAQIKISNCEDGKQERRINICGSYDSVQTAQLLINSSLELYKQSVKLKAATNTNSSILLTTPLLPNNYPFPSVLSQNFLQISQQPFFAFKPYSDSDLNISLLNTSQSQECKLTVPITSSTNNDHEEYSRCITKLKCSQNHLDGSKNIPLYKFKPY